MKPVLRLPGMKRLKLAYDEPLKSLAFSFNLRCYILDLKLTPYRVLATGSDTGRAWQISPATYSNAL